MRFGISLPQVVGPAGFEAGAFRAYLERAEGLGFESAWTMEHVLGDLPFLAPLETLTYAAARTERIRLGCVVFVTPLHNPVHLAKAVGTLDQLAGGRLEIGVGTGGKARMFSAFEVDPSSLTARFTEGLRLMKALWAESDVVFDGRFWQLRGATVEPKPVQRPHPPLWFGGSHPAALRRAVRHGDGFFGAGSSTTAQFTQQMQAVREALADADRDPATFATAKRVYLVVDDDAARARQRAADQLVRIYGDFGRTLAPVAVCGPPDAIVEGVREVADGGAELILLNPLVDEAAQMEQLAAEVMPRLA
jgi:probable F420-dependent oxidoreductase